MIETLEPQTEKIEQAILCDGNIVDVDMAHITMRSMCEALQNDNNMRSFHTTDRLIEIRLWAHEVEAFAAFWNGEPASKKREVNDLLRSPIFDVKAFDYDWHVPPETALAVVRNTVVANIEDKFQLKEPFPDRAMLSDTWLELESQRTQIPKLNE